MTSSEIRDNYHALVRTDVFPLVPRGGGTLLDIGGGIGATSAAIKQQGYVERAGVIDLVSQDARKRGLDFHYSGDLEKDDVLGKAIKKEGPFSVILCLDVLEHVADPWTLVKNLSAALTPGGVIIASIPNIRFYEASFPLFFRGEWELADRGILDNTHLRWFVRKTAVELMTSSGLELEKIVDKPGGGRKIRLIRAVTLGFFNTFTNLQYLIRVKKSL